MPNKKVMLIIMDGWGKGLGDKTDAIACAKTPYVDSLYKNYPHAELITHSEWVGLPHGQMGNSEVGHLNIGAGRVVYQDLLKIDNAVRDKILDTNPVLIDTLNYVKEKKCNLHLMGLVSDGGVHSSLVHLKALCDIINQHQVENVFLHAFTDGRDTDPTGGLGYVTEMQNHIAGTSIELVSVIGRYYAMDRDKRWERVKLAYDLLVNKKGKAVASIADGIKESYVENVTDEFIKPIFLADKMKPIAADDAVICFNFRTDRCREITTVLTQTDMPEQGMNTMPLKYVTMCNYDATYKNVSVIFDNENVQTPLGEVLAMNGKTQIRIAETEKYPHVTFFFNGGREEPFVGEKRIMIPSPKVATYDLQPEMSAEAVKDAILKEINLQSADFICLNFANADMVGHTGVFSAVVKAVETVDKCVSEIAEAALRNDYSIFLTADHGNADYMINPDGSPNTAHTKNPVPLFFINQNEKPDLKSGKLADLAPTILKWMGIEIPKVMTGDLLM